MALWTHPDAFLFAAIDAHRRSEAQCNVLWDKQGHEELLKSATEAEKAALAMLFNVTPATPAGMRALLAYALATDSQGNELRPIVEAVLRSPVLAEVDARNSDAWNMA